MDNYSDNLDVEVLLFKEEYDEKFSQVTEEIDRIYTQKRERSGTSSRRLVNTSFINTLLIQKIILNILKVNHTSIL
jgi:hypothetical protein